MKILLHPGKKQITLLSSVCLRPHFPLQSQQLIAYCECKILFFLARSPRKRSLFHGFWLVLIFCGTQIVQRSMFQYLLLAIVKGLEEGVGFVLTRKGKVEELDFYLNFLRCFFHKEPTNSLQTHSHPGLESIAYFESQLKGPIVYYVPGGGAGGGRSETCGV